MLASSFRDLRVHCGTRTYVSSQWTSTALTLRLLPITQRRQRQLSSPTSSNTLRLCAEIYADIVEDFEMGNFGE